MAKSYDAVVIGAGHNGLTAAAYLGSAGLDVLVLERREVVGGAAVTEEFHPGFRASAASYVVSLLRPEVVRDLELARHGFETVPMRGHAALLPDGRHLILNGEADHDRAQFARHSNRDAEAYARFSDELTDLAGFVAGWMLREPPALAGGWADLWQGLRLGRDLRGLSPGRRHRLLQLFTSPPASLLERWFDSEIVKMMLAGSITVANPASLLQPGPAINLLHLSMGEAGGKKGSWAIAKGGMGAITQAMAAAARARGVEIRTAAPVARVEIEDGRASGVRLQSGEVVAARAVLANSDPKRTFLGLVGKDHLPPDFAADLAVWRQWSGSFRMNIALAGTPQFNGVLDEELETLMGSLIILAPSLEAFEDAYQAARQGELPNPPILDIHLPTALDPDLAPAGCHVLSLIAQHYPYRLSGGRTWEGARELAAFQIIEALAAYIPNIRDLMKGWKAYSPWDLEQVFGLTGGDVYHGRLDPDQMFSLRPHPEAARYRTPVAGLYLCGAGAHPGGGVSGAPGHNAAKRVLKDLGQ